MSTNMKEEKLSALTRQKEELLKIRDSYPETSNDYRMFNIIIGEHDKEIKKILGE